jgi:flagellar hook-length control protein FliK
MNPLLLHVAGESPVGGMPEIRKLESCKELSGSFSEHLQGAVAARPDTAPSFKREIRPGAISARSAAPSAGKSAASEALQRAPQQAESKRAPSSVTNGRDNRGESSDVSTTDRAGKQGRNTDEPRRSAVGTPVSPLLGGGRIASQRSTAQPASSAAGETPSSQTGFKTPNKAAQSFAVPGTPAGAQLPGTVLTLSDLMLAVTQPIAPAETNAVTMSPAPASGPLVRDSNEAAGLPQVGSRDESGVSASAGHEAAKNGSGCGAEAELSGEVLDPGKASSDPTAEDLSLQLSTAADLQQSSSENSAPAGESAPVKGAASHNTSAFATVDFRGGAPTPAAFTGPLHMVEPVGAAPRRAFVETASSGDPGGRDAQTGSSPHPSAPSTPSSPATSKESTPSGRASSWPVPPSAGEDAPSTSLNAPLVGSSGTTTGEQSGAAASADHPAPGAPLVNLASYRSHGSTGAVPSQPEFGGAVVPDSSTGSPAQAEQTSGTRHDGILEAWQTASAQLERVNGATLHSLQNGTEMRVQMHTDAFGPVEIRATLQDGKIGAAIGVENPEAHHTLLGHVSALQQSLADRHVQLDQVTVVRTSGQNSPDLGWSSNQEREDTSGYTRLGHQARGENLASQPVIAPEFESVQTERQWGRLSVRA